MSKMSSMPPKPPQMPHIPEMTPILTRLPVKSLLRFRCVSKTWCAEIDDPYFINLHLNHSLTTGANHSPIAKSGKYLYSLTDSLNKLEKTPIPFGSKTSVFNTCRGLLLLKANGRWFIFNSSTRKYTFVPQLPSNSKYVDARSDEWCNCLGYDVVNDDYKVFLIHTYVTFEAHIYSLKSNLWHTVKDFAKPKLYDCSFEVYVDGALHTINSSKRALSSKLAARNTTILALDVEKEEFNLIPMPVVDEYRTVMLFDVHVFDRCLAVSCQYLDYETRIWVMKKYGEKESWSMLLSVRPRYSGSLIPPVVIPIVYSKSRNEVLLSYNRKKLVWYDLRDGAVCDFEVDDVPTGFGPMVCVESLISVTGKIGDMKKRPGEEKMKEDIVKMKRDSK